MNREFKYNNSKRVTLPEAMQLSLKIFILSNTRFPSEFK